LDDPDSLRYAIHSDEEAVGYFAIDPVKGVIKTTAVLDHELFESVLLNVRAYSDSNKYYGAHTQVRRCTFSIANTPALRRNIITHTSGV
jgi:hypothetical protein